MKVTVLLNAARYSMMDGYDRQTAELLDGFNFENGREAVPGGGVATQRDIDAALNEIYELLNVGGDLVPHRSWSRAYREQGHRSLSVGDVVVIDGYGFFAVASMGFEEVDGGSVRLAQARAEASGAVADDRKRKAEYVEWLAEQPSLD